jgi:hypothetical protein
MPKDQPVGSMSVTRGQARDERFKQARERRRWVIRVRAVEVPCEIVGMRESHRIGVPSDGAEKWLLRTQDGKPCRHGPGPAVEDPHLGAAKRRAQVQLVESSD